MGRLVTITRDFLDFTGLDLIPYAFGISKFTSKSSFEPSNLNAISENIQNLDTKKLDDALDYSKELFTEETTRGENAENKAYSLLGVTGISAAFVTGISSLFPKDIQTLSSVSINLTIAFYILIVASLTMTVLLASKSVLVRSYAHPDISDIFHMTSKSVKETKQGRLASYIYCYGKNCQTHNVKVSYLIGAQLWFRNSIVFLLILAFIIITNIFNVSKSNVASIVIPTVSSTTTQTINNPTFTNQPPDSVQPSQTPTPLPIITMTSTRVIPTNTLAP